MKPVGPGVVVMTESAITFPWDPGKAYTVVLNRKTCCVQYFHFTQRNQHKYTEGLKYGDNQGHYITL